MTESLYEMMVLSIASTDWNERSLEDLETFTETEVEDE